MEIKSEEHYTCAEVASFLKIKTATLSKWRQIKKFNLRYYKAGGMVRYRGSDVLQWIEDNMK